MTTKPSLAPWADEPFRLLPTPAKRLTESHHYVRVTTEMVHSHNCLLRGLNAILQQAPHVPISTDKNYRQQDVKDLLVYVDCWVKMVHHHHWVEESFMFPELEKFTGRPGVMEDPQHQHEEFTPGMERLATYVANTEPEAYRWEGSGGMKELIDDFSGSLTEHLYAEIDVFLRELKDTDSEGLKELWDRVENVAKQSGNFGMLYDVFPCVLGNCDKTYEGGTDFPPLPGILIYAIKYWFAARNGAWRFNPCDFWGRPRPLAFVPQSGEQ